MPTFDDETIQYMETTRLLPTEINKINKILENPTPKQGRLIGKNYNGFPIYHYRHAYSSEIGKCLWIYDESNDKVHFLGFYREQGDGYKLKDNNGTPSAPDLI